MFHWVLEPLGDACERLGVSANGVTWVSLLLAGAAGIALARGHAGLGASLATVSAAGDALDGAIARRTNTASEAGEVLDAAVDRYSEFAFLGGLAFLFRDAPVLLVLTLFALLASFMVSYSTAKAEALQLPAPRGSMRRTERAVFLILGAALVPFATAASPAWGRAPIVAALALVAVVGNVSAVRRLAAIARGARSRQTERRLDASPAKATPASSRPELSASVPTAPAKLHGRAP